MSAIGRYQIRRELGRGDMATTYLPFDRETAIAVDAVWGEEMGRY